jgi:hypothetical protein
MVIATPDKDLGQCVVGRRIEQWDRVRDAVRDADAALAKTGMLPARPPVADANTSWAMCHLTRIPRTA